MSDATNETRARQAPPLVRPAPPGASPAPSPNDHLRLLVELLRPAGAELARRWVGALLAAPERDREEIVRSVERRMAEVYGAPVGGRTREPALRVRTPGVQRAGFVEETVRTYERAPEAPSRPKARRKTGA